MSGSMTAEERVATFINSLETANSDILEQIEQEALDAHIPIIKKETQSFLRVLLQMKQPTSILEIGAAVGFSSLFMSEYAPVGCKVTTIEKVEKRALVAEENFRKANKEKEITLIRGDAMLVLEELDESFDFIFMDAAKGQYIHYFPNVLRLLKVGGVLLSDNVLQDGDIIESRYAIEKRNRTIHDRMREYLYLLKHHEELVTSIIPLGDGVAVSYKL
jgi:predicted O-methyltransferase YrrM